MQKCNKCNMLLSDNVVACHVCGTRINQASEPAPRAAQAMPEQPAQDMPSTSRAGTVHDIANNGLQKLAQLVQEPSLKAMCQRGAQVIEKGHPTERAAEAVAEIVELAQSEAGRSLIGRFLGIAKEFVEKK